MWRRRCLPNNLRLAAPHFINLQCGSEGDGPHVDLVAGSPRSRSVCIFVFKELVYRAEPRCNSSGAPAGRPARGQVGPENESKSMISCPPPQLPLQPLVKKVVLVSSGRQDRNSLILGRFPTQPGPGGAWERPRVECWCSSVAAALAIQVKCSRSDIVASPIGL